ncbi:MAG: c-type cytochrome domain-containing protein, partial [Planctomycetota bacterium]
MRLDKMRCVLRLILSLLCAVCHFDQSLLSQDAADPQAIVFFESKIRPLLEKHCLECHQGKDSKADLDLSHRIGWQNAGVIKLKDPKNSLLLTVVTSEDPDVRMPPPPKDPLSKAEQSAVLEWISQGAYDPRSQHSESTESIGPKKRNRIFEITE